MHRKPVRYAASEIGRVRVVEDFLPPPEALVPREENVISSSVPPRRVVYLISA